VRALSLREKALVVACVVVLVGVALVQFGGRMGAVQAKPEAAELSRRRTQLLAEIGRMHTAIAKLTLPADKAVPEALSLVGRAAKQSGVTVDSARPLRDVMVGGLTRHAVQFNVSGGFTEVATLLEGLQRPGARLVVERVEISSADAGSDRVQAQLRLAGFEPAREVSRRRVRP